jgi:hypothetical protein
MSHSSEAVVVLLEKGWPASGAKGRGRNEQRGHYSQTLPRWGGHDGHDGHGRTRADQCARAFKADCVADDFGGEVVVLNLVSGVYFSLRDLAAAVWRDLAAGHPPELLVDGINRVDERIAEATATLIDDFERAGLMRRGSPRPVEMTAPESIAVLRAGEARLTFECFEDMKDLILSDPIHDSDDQMGWPTLQRTEKS